MVAPPLLLTSSKTPLLLPPTLFQATPSAVLQRLLGPVHHHRAYWAWAEAHYLCFLRPRTSISPLSLTACPASNHSTSLAHSDLGLWPSPLGSSTPLFSRTLEDLHCIMSTWLQLGLAGESSIFLRRHWPSIRPRDPAPSLIPVTPSTFSFNKNTTKMKHIYVTKHTLNTT